MSRLGPVRASAEASWRNMNALLVAMREWYQHPAFVNASPSGMPVTTAEIGAAYGLFHQGLAHMVSINGGHYLQPNGKE